MRLIKEVIENLQVHTTGEVRCFATTCQVSLDSKGSRCFDGMALPSGGYTEYTLWMSGGMRVTAEVYTTFCGIRVSPVSSRVMSGGGIVTFPLTRIPSHKTIGEIFTSFATVPYCPAVSSAIPLTGNSPHALPPGRISWARFAGLEETSGDTEQVACNLVRDKLEEEVGGMFRSYFPEPGFVWREMTIEEACKSRIPVYLEETSDGWDKFLRDLHYLTFSCGDLEHPPIQGSTSKDEPSIPEDVVDEEIFEYPEEELQALRRSLAKSLAAVHYLDKREYQSMVLDFMAEDILTGNLELPEGIRDISKMDRSEVVSALVKIAKSGSDK